MLKRVRLHAYLAGRLLAGCAAPARVAQSPRRTTSGRIVVATTVVRLAELSSAMRMMAAADACQA